MSEEHLYRYTQCGQCGEGFKDDCGESFCSSRCEKEYERQHIECEQCGRDVGEDNLVDGICWSCEKDNEEEEE